MAIFKSDGNGNYTISKASTISIGLTIMLLTIIVGFASYTAAQSQAIEDHINNSNIHWAKTQLDYEFIPRRELQSELRAIRQQLSRIEAKLDRLEQ